MDYFYPRSPCGERRWLRCWQLAARDISIHALLAESDIRKRQVVPVIQISIHALLAESDQPAPTRNDKHNVFLSTLSLRRATSRQVFCFARLKNFYPRSPCGERLQWEGMRSLSEVISIHALLAESDISAKREPRKSIISIHALLAESDNTVNITHNSQAIFLSTLSLRRATKPMPLIRFCLGTFLSTLSLRRATLNCSRNGLAIRYFYPRSPCGERRKSNKLAGSKLVFLSTLSLRRATYQQTAYFF